MPNSQSLDYPLDALIGPEYFTNLDYLSSSEKMAYTLLTTELRKRLFSHPPSSASCRTAYIELATLTRAMSVRRAQEEARLAAAMPLRNKLITPEQITRVSFFSPQQKRDYSQRARELGEVMTSVAKGHKERLSAYGKLARFSQAVTVKLKYDRAVAQAAEKKKKKMVREDKGMWGIEPITKAMPFPLDKKLVEMLIRECKGDVGTAFDRLMVYLRREDAVQPEVERVKNEDDWVKSTCLLCLRCWRFRRRMLRLRSCGPRASCWM